MGKILIVDDDETFVEILSGYIRSHYPLLEVETGVCPHTALQDLCGNISLLLIELAKLDGDRLKTLEFARQCGVDKNRVVIISGRDAEYLHEQFPMGTCLAVLNKYEPKQKAVLDMIFTSLSKKAAAVI